MISQPLPSHEESARYFNIMAESVAVNKHIDLLHWLQGDMQHFLPHDILMAGWGNFEDGSVQHDIVSRLPGVRSYAPGADCLPFLLSKLHSRWAAAGKTPVSLDFAEFVPLLGSTSLPGSLSGALRSMQSVMVHGLKDRRGRHECLYVLFRAGDIPVQRASSAMTVLMPCIDATLRQLTHLPQQHAQAIAQPHAQTRTVNEDASGLSERETQIMAWVAMGKTNSEIGTILHISGYTVKNHMQRIFHKLNVFNRTQAVSKVTRAIDG
ncbi:MAG: transcriptional regulator, LuxR family [Polaromonas sp.]|nr:transcriptional regulator, LuxR family [Polaromonas sp.]